MTSAIWRHPKSIATVSLAGTLPEKLEAAAAAGFDGVEIFENDLLSFAGTPERVRRIAADLGLTIMLYQPLRDFEAVPEPIRARNLARAERKFDVMQELGARMLLVCSTVQDNAIDDPTRAAADLRAMAEAAEKRGLLVAYEALAWGRHTRRWRQAWEIVRQADHPALGLALDSFHTLALGDTLAGINEVPAGKIFFVQLADAPQMSMDVLSWSRHYRNFPGQGDLGVTEFARAVMGAGYRGPLSLEIFNDEFRAAPAHLTALDGLRSLIWLESEAGGAALPAAPCCGAVEFLEFAVDNGAGRELAAHLRTLGFRHAGRHRSKAADLYRQGEVDIILNAEPDSAAAEHFQLHGPSVCALGLQVDDAQRAIARARALLCKEWRARIGPDERCIPALRTPDGMLFYLLDRQDSIRRVYASEFVSEPGAANNTAPGLAAIDHIAQALPSHQFGSFVLFYKTVFGLQAQAQQEIADPYGLVKSRAMVSVDQNLRIALNVAASQHTVTGRFINAYAGAGIHHIALRTMDLRATLRQIEPAAAMLHVPEHYYDDVGARFGLDDAALEPLRRHRMLYDRDAGGEFLHVYAEPFQQRFFFELVQRDAYLGFGAANASLRMAAQALASGKQHAGPAC